MAIELDYMESYTTNTLAQDAYIIAPGWLVGWDYRRKITIDYLLVDADLVDFPVLVKLTSTNFSFAIALSDGADI
jgi:hypothetical protein